MSDPEINEADRDKGKLRIDSEDLSAVPETSPIADLEKWLKPDAPDEIKERFSGIQRRVSFMGYSGPLPPASELIRYEEAHPGAADRVIGLVEDTLRMRNNVFEKQIGLSRRRVNASVIMSLGMLIIAGLAIVFDPA